MSSYLPSFRKTYDFVSKLHLPRMPSSVSPSENEQKYHVFTSILSNIETYVVSLQSLLIWEKPYLSAAAFIFITCVYWLFVLWKRRFLSILSIISMVVFLYRSWIYQIWPEIRVPPEEPEDTEEWTHINPQVLSAPELSQYLNSFCDKIIELWKDVWKLRKENHGLFCFFMCGFFMIFVIIGHYIPGVLLCYIFVLLVSLGPGVALHLIPKTIYDQMVGYFTESDMQGEVTKSTGTSEDSDLEEFIPEPSAELIRELSLKEVPEIPSPGAVLFETSDINELADGLEPFPSLEEEGESEVEDDISDIIVPKTEESNKNELHFLPSHFKEDTSESESDAVFTEGLSFNGSQDKGVGTSKDVSKLEFIPLDSKEENKAVRVEAQRQVSSSSDIDDELMDFEILEDPEVAS